MNREQLEQLRQYCYLFGEIDAAYHEIFQRQGLSDSVGKILYTICCNGGSQPLNEICRTMGLSKQTANSAMRKLEGEGMIYLDAIDGKSKMVCLTQTGKQLAEKMIMPVIEMENSIYGSWTREEQDIYLELTVRFLRDLREKSQTIGERRER